MAEEAKSQADTTAIVQGNVRLHWVAVTTIIIFWALAVYLTVVFVLDYAQDNTSTALKTSGLDMVVVDRINQRLER